MLAAFVFSATLLANPIPHTANTRCVVIVRDLKRGRIMRVPTSLDERLAQMHAAFMNQKYGSAYNHTVACLRPVAIS